MDPDPLQNLAGARSRAPELILTRGGHDRLRGGHPWVYRGEVADVRGVWVPGTVATVLDAAGRFVGRGFYNPRPGIACRLLTRRDEPVDARLFERRLAAALAYRRAAGLVAGAYRLCWSEADGLPGLVVDRYGPVSVVQPLTLGVVRHVPWVAAALAALFPGEPVYRVDDPTAARVEGFTAERGWLGPDGAPTASSPPGLEEPLMVTEGDCRFAVELGTGHKTGLYLDQRDNRLALAARATGRRMLDAFCYAGGFACHGLRAGATHATLIDASPEALAAAARNLAANGVAERATLVGANAFDHLRALEAAGERFDLVVLDPPPFTRRKDALEAAARGYKEINLRGLKLLGPGGVLATFSCSHHVTPALFEEICRQAAADARVTARLLAVLAQARDHPVLLGVPESRYLTGLLLEAV